MQEKKVMKGKEVRDEAMVVIRRASLTSFSSLTSLTPCTRTGLAAQAQ